MNTTKIELTDYEVQIKAHMNWGDRERIKATMIASFPLEKGQKMTAEEIMESKYLLLEALVTNVIPKGEGKEATFFSRDWMNALSIEDGDKLYAACANVHTPAKKETVLPS